MPGYLSFVTFVCIYGIALPVVSSDPTARGTQIAASIWIWVFSIFYVLYVVRWFGMVSKGTSKTIATTKVLYSFADVLCSHYHVAGALGFSIWLMDASPGKDVYFTGIPVANLAYPYKVYIGDWLLLSLTIFNSAGSNIVKPQPSTIVSALWVMYTSLAGLALVGFLLAVIIQRRDELPKRQYTSQQFSAPTIRPHINKL